MSQDYWCVIVTKDGAATIGTTVDSIIHQSVPPKFIVLVNDGSTDETVRIVQSKPFPGTYILNTGSGIRDIRKVPRLLNLALNFVWNGKNGLPTTDYMMVSGDDNELSQDYAETLLDRMESNPKLVVTSGEWLISRARRGDQMPHGGGRFVKTSYMKEIGGQYPVAYGWETWLLYKALELGYKVRLYPDVRYKHLRLFQSVHLFGWGRAMYSLGFPSYFVSPQILDRFTQLGPRHTEPTGRGNYACRVCIRRAESERSKGYDN